MLRTSPTQFSLRAIFFVTATCAVAFWIIAQDLTRTLTAIAACVPIFWLGIGCLQAGDGMQQKAESSQSPLARWMKATGVTAFLAGAACVSISVLSTLVAIIAACVAMLIGG